jgi:hypothetical protein
LRDVQDGKREKAAEKNKANAELKKAAEAEGGTASGTARKQRRREDFIVGNVAGC